MFHFDECMGPETVDREYKEFSLHKTGVPFDIDQAELYCASNQFAFDDLVLSNIQKYIQQYIPKYMSGFWNSGIQGEMWIGTDDYGFIKGIPMSLSRSLDTTWIEECIRDTIRTHIRFDEEHTPSFSVKVHSVARPETQKGVHPMYSFYLDKKKEFIQEYQSFLHTYQEWQHTYEVVNMKLVDIVNRPEYRASLISFIRQSEHRNENVIRLLLDPTYELPSLSGEDIKDMKHDPESVFYWVTHLKDMECEKYRRDKPYFLNKFKQRHIPFNLLISISEMIPYWDVQLYLICIQSGTGPKCTYFNGHQWIRCTRTMNLDQPVCLPCVTE